MTVFVALLRAVNVGGTGKLPMADLRAIAERQGFRDVATYIQSGNLVFRTELTRQEAQARLEEALAAHFGRSADVFLRTAEELQSLSGRIPFADAAPNQVLITFLPEEASADALEHMIAPDGEQAAVLGSEIAVHFPNGMGRSKLKLPAVKPGTARNLNTVHKLLEMARQLEGAA
ncbi:DUF1697 domain-containing protein [Roseibium salinum]|uniref:DUF1697 domain-containing protein n=1 Tax=Roseibium salinum TaxID=1604349 RepID=A0ABT3R6R0_9HYPH|nr:DUF1697 domain-containing protein [Roseibium sp. DSM 29163]MCX2724977.1 DUF1697 domain-containing protein [Roseibium sp. DSM 29163]MDN3721099.1 DUF1697 domain-containing protein [Roseibium salinum]